MTRVMWQASDELMERVRAAAELRGRTLNDYMSSVLDAATNPDLGGTEAERLRVRLERAGILARPGKAARWPVGRELSRPAYPAKAFEDLSAIVGLGPESLVLEVGCGTGQATLPLALTGASVLAIEIGPSIAAIARRRLGAFPKVAVVTGAFEDWDPGTSRFDLLAAATSWHWIDPAMRWQKAYDLLNEGGWLAIIGHTVVRDPGKPEVFAETADIHERFAPGYPAWELPPTADEVMAVAAESAGSIAALESALGRVPDGSSTAGRFRPPVIRWYQHEQWFDSKEYIEHVSTSSMYANLAAQVREPLLDAVAERIRTSMDDKVARRYLVALRLAQRES